MPSVFFQGYTVDLPDALPVMVVASCKTIATGTVPFNYAPNSAGSGGAGATWISADGVEISFDGTDWWIDHVPCSNNLRWPMFGHTYQNAYQPLNWMTC